MEWLKVRRELVKEYKQMREVKYFGHIKRHNTIIETILFGYRNVETTLL